MKLLSFVIILTLLMFVESRRMSMGRGGRRGGDVFKKIGNGVAQLITDAKTGKLFQEQDKSIPGKQVKSDLNKLRSHQQLANDFTSYLIIGGVTIIISVLVLCCIYKCHNWIQHQKKQLEARQAKKRQQKKNEYYSVIQHIYDHGVHPDKGKIRECKGTKAKHF